MVAAAWSEVLPARGDCDGESPCDVVEADCGGGEPSSIALPLPVPPVPLPMGMAIVRDGTAGDGGSVLRSGAMLALMRVWRGAFGIVIGGQALRQPGGQVALCLFLARLSVCLFWRLK